MEPHDFIYEGIIKMDVIPENIYGRNGIPIIIESLNKFSLPYYIIEINSLGYKWEKYVNKNLT